MRFLFAILLIVFCTSCSTSSESPDIDIVTIQDSSKTIQVKPLKQKNMESEHKKLNFDHIEIDDVPYWYADYDSRNNLDIIVRGSLVDTKYKTPKSLINKLNEVSKTKMIFKKISNDTIYVRLVDDYYVTEQSGSTGAMWWIAGRTFTLTGLRNINYVNFDFEEGSHLVPGVYDRNNFNNLEIVK